MSYIIKLPNIKYVSTISEAKNKKSSIQNKIRTVQENKEVLSLSLNYTRMLIAFLEDKKIEDLKEIGIKLDYSMFDSKDVSNEEYYNYLLEYEKVLVEQLGCQISILSELNKENKEFTKDIKKESNEPKKTAKKDNKVNDKKDLKQENKISEEEKKKIKASWS